MNRVILDPRNPFHLMPVVLAQNPDLVIALPVFAPHDPNSALVLRAQRKIRRLPPDLAAHLAQAQAANSGNGSKPGDPPTHIEIGRLLLTVPVDVAQNLRGPVAERHPTYLIQVHRSAYDAAIRQAETGLVLPGMGPRPGGGIIKP